MLNDLTPISGVNKLLYGTILQLDIENKTFSTSKYFELPKHTINSTPTSELLLNFSETLSSAIAYEWNKDQLYNYTHFSFLSGGLDSRFNVLMANHLGYNGIHSLTFSESGTLDELIAT